MSTPASATIRSRVEWVDTDASGHHHNSSIIRYIEAAEAELMRSRGLDTYFGSSPRVLHEVHYESRLWFGQELTATVWLDRVGTTSMTWTFEVWGEAQADRPRGRAAHGRFVVAHVPDPDRGAQPWPRKYLDALVPDEEDAQVNTG